MRRPLLIAGSVLAVTTVGYGIFAAVSFMAHSRTRSAISMPGEITTIELDLSAGDVVLTGDNVDTVSGERIVDRGLRAPSFKEERVGTTLRLKASCPPLVGVNCNVRYELRVPASVKVTGSSDGGTIRTDGVTGSVDVSSSGGSVTIVGSVGEVHASSSGGSVKVLDSRSKTVEADSSGGSVRLSFLDPPTNVDASSSGGGVSIALPRDESGYNVDASSSGGSRRVDVRTDPDSPKLIKADSSGGNVTVEYVTAA
jgi:DUF4097 and DUF4098 domain-containing protein YvlB